MRNFSTCTRKKCKVAFVIILSVELITLAFLGYSGRLTSSSISRKIPTYRGQNTDKYHQQKTEKELGSETATTTTIGPSLPLAVTKQITEAAVVTKNLLTNGPTARPPSDTDIFGELGKDTELFPPLLPEELKKAIILDMEQMTGRKEKPKFNPDFKNPCWYEEAPLPGAYDTNWYRNNHPFKDVMPMKFDKMELELTPKWVQTGRRLRCLPYFYLAGIAKCGTTDLYLRIKDHPHVTDGLLKVIQWWNRLAIRIKGNLEEKVSFGEFLDIFDHAASEIEDNTCSNCSHLHPSIVGDYSTSTLFDNDFWPEMRGNNASKHEPDITVAHYMRYLQPGVKIIAIFREPTARLYSDYLFFTGGVKSEGKSPAKFHEWASAAVLLFLSCTKHYSVRSCVYSKELNHQKPLAVARLRLGLYHVFVKDFLNVFPRDQLLFLRLEDYHSDMRGSLNKVYEFLGLKKLNPWEEDEILARAPTNSRTESYSTIGKMWDSTRTLLREFYASHNDQLADLLNDDRFRWADVLADTNIAETNTTTER
ncbi:carbohydrate sulfotransferase 15 [Lingula anatina]|uniref:Carbohydrate sulfotransferase 15 n=1 Tax=Lingula anatina TaxID=7574 RepID=A0A1S3HHX4_LINAN|nr:carbohydrate sulfotransferase 15 [Lingula anatina]|eukprot:XP_013385081.1 carbohydrate sulfotransferase 15 [Lingula anatina]